MAKSLKTIDVILPIETAKQVVKCLAGLNHNNESVNILTDLMQYKLDNEPRVTFKEFNELKKGDVLVFDSGAMRPVISYDPKYGSVTLEKLKCNKYKSSTTVYHYADIAGKLVRISKKKNKFKFW